MWENLKISCLQLANERLPVLIGHLSAAMFEFLQVRDHQLDHKRLVIVELYTGCILPEERMQILSRGWDSVYS